MSNKTDNMGEIVEMVFRVRLPLAEANRLAGMMEYLAYCGDVGITANINFEADGDGEFRMEMDAEYPPSVRPSPPGTYVQGDLIPHTKDIDEDWNPPEVFIEDFDKDDGCVSF